MFQQYDDPAPLPIRRIAQPSGLARQRMVLLREREQSSGHLSYALVLIFLFQTLLLGCVTLFLGALVLFSFIGVSFRAQEANQLSVALTRIAPLIGTPTVSALLPPTSTLSVAVPSPTAVNPTPETQVTPIPLPTPTLLAPPVLENPAPTATSAAISPLPVQPAERAAMQSYGAQILPIIDQLSATIATVQGLAQNPNLNDQQWVDNATIQIGLVRSAYNNLQTVPPPPPVAALHSELLNIVTTCLSAADSFNNTIASRNPANLNTDVAALQNCLTNFSEVSNRLRSYIQFASQ